MNEICEAYKKVYERITSAANHKMSFMNGLVVSGCAIHDDTIDFFVCQADGEPIMGGMYFSVDRKTKEVIRKALTSKEIESYEQRATWIKLKDIQSEDSTLDIPVLKLNPNWDEI